MEASVMPILDQIIKEAIPEVWEYILEQERQQEQRIIRSLYAPNTVASRGTDNLR